MSTASKLNMPVSPKLKSSFIGTSKLNRTEIKSKERDSSLCDRLNAYLKKTDESEEENGEPNVVFSESEMDEVDEHPSARKESRSLIHQPRAMQSSQSKSFLSLRKNSFIGRTTATPNTMTQNSSSKEKHSNMRS